MANKRTLKHAINCICEDLFAGTIAASLYGAENHKENAEALLFSIVKMRRDYISRVSHPEPGMAPSFYFKKLRESFSAQVGELIDQIDNL